jgi:hypothetical protein
LATGVDFGEALAAVACGQIPDLRTRRSRAAVLSFLRPDRPGVLVRRDAHSSVVTGNPWIELFWNSMVGDTVASAEHDPDAPCVGYVLATGDGVAQCRDRITLASSLLDLHVAAHDTAAMV